MPAKRTDFALRTGFVALYALVFVSVLYWSYQLEGTNPWQGWTYNPGPWCEKERTNNLIREPANAWSDFSFLAVGFFMLYCGTHDLLFPKPSTKNPVVAFPLISIICGIANVLHACGTFFYHSCRCTEGHILDISGMFTVTAFPFFYSLFRLLTVPSWDSTRNTTPISKLSLPSLRPLQLKVVLLCVAIAAFFGVGVWWSGSHHYTDERRDAVMTVIIVSDIVTSLLHFSLKLHSTQRGRVFKGMARAVVMLLVGLTVHSIDRFHKTMFPMLCFPSSPLQGHAIWHVATASSLFILYYLDRTENFVDLSATLKTFY